MQKECQKINLKRKDNKINPLYTQKEVDEIMSMTRGYNYNQEIKLNDNVKIEFIPSGHISGAAMVLLTYHVSEYEKKTVLFTGDTSGLKDKPFTMKPNLEKLKVNMIITESTYGNSDKKEYDPIKQLKEQIDKTVINKQKTLLIPVFAIARSTEMIYLLREIIENDSKYNEVEISFASPMAIKANKVILNPDNFMFYDKQWHGQKDLIKWDRINYIDNFEEVKSQLINNKPKIVLAASGMMQVGFSNYLAGHYLKYKGNHILLTGYSAEGTVSRVLYDGIQKSVAISGVQTPIRCEVSLLEGMSSHCSGIELIKLFNQLEKKKIQKICVLHGNEDQRLGFKDKLEKEFKSAKVILPKYAQCIKI
jgi:metallo-beta-lactamase family protein